MKTIFKYPLYEDEVSLPKGATILHIGVQDQELFAWALVDKGNEKVPMLRIIGTGHLITDFDRLGEFLGTHIIHNERLVFHVFKIV